MIPRAEDMAAFHDALDLVALFALIWCGCKLAENWLDRRREQR